MKLPDQTERSQLQNQTTSTWEFRESECRVRADSGDISALRNYRAFAPPSLGSALKLEGVALLDFPVKQQPRGDAGGRSLRMDGFAAWLSEVPSPMLRCHKKFLHFCQLQSHVA